MLNKKNRGTFVAKLSTITVTWSSLWRFRVIDGSSTSLQLPTYFDIIQSPLHNDYRIPITRGETIAHANAITGSTWTSLRNRSAKVEARSYTRIEVSFLYRHGGPRAMDADHVPPGRSTAHHSAWDQRAFSRSWRASSKKRVLSDPFGTKFPLCNFTRV